jgi:cyanophycinase
MRKLMSNIVDGIYRGLIAFGVGVVSCACVTVTALAACRTAETEPNNSDTTANADVCAGVAISGNISSASDYDWYQLNVTAPGTLSISLSHDAGIDLDWYLYKSTGSYIAYASTSANPETGSKAVTTAGIYYIRVKNYSGSGNYSLTVSGPIAAGGTGGGLPAPSFGSFSIPTKTPGDAPFAIVAPTSNSTGAFTFSSSNTGVATVSGSTITVLAAGTSTITASQAATSSYTAGSTSAVFTVGSAVWPCTLPTGVNLGKVGSTTDVTPATTGGFVLMGGGTDVDAAIQWMIAKSGGGDVVVLRSTGTNAYNSYIQGLGTVNSVQTLLIDTVAEGDNACVGETIKRAEMVFIAGGNQQNYVDYFKGKAVGTALNYLINTKKVPIGGTSAGMAIMGQYYHPGGAADDASSLSNPTAVAIGNNFLNNTLLNNVITDTHFTQRTRPARLSAFLASTIYNFGVTWQNIRGIACDEATAYALDTTGAGKVFGSNACFFVKPTGAPETLAANTALTWSLNFLALNVYRIPGTTNGTNTFEHLQWNRWYNAGLVGIEWQFYDPLAYRHTVNGLQLFYALSCINHATRLCLQVARNSRA